MNERPAKANRGGKKKRSRSGRASAPQGKVVCPVLLPADEALAKISKVELTVG
jgi:hypothetical protein